MTQHLTSSSELLGCRPISRSVLTVVHVIEWPWEEPPPPRWHELPPEQARALADYRLAREVSVIDRVESLRPACASAASR